MDHMTILYNSLMDHMTILYNSLMDHMTNRFMSEVVPSYLVKALAWQQLSHVKPTVKLLWHLMMMVMHLVIFTLMMEILLNLHSKNKKMHMCYRIVNNFGGQKLWRIRTVGNLVECYGNSENWWKNLANCCSLQNVPKLFYCQSFLLYGIITCMCIIAYLLFLSILLSLASPNTSIYCKYAIVIILASTITIP